MTDTATSFQARRFYIAGELGLPTGLGVRLGASIIPEVGVDAHVGTALLWQDYGADLVVRPLARHYNVTPTLRFGMSVLQNNLAGGWGGPPWIPTPSASVGVDWVANCGFMLGAHGGVALPMTPGQGGLPTVTKLAPDFGLSAGWAF